MRWSHRTTARESSKWRKEWSNQEGFVLGTTVGKVAASDPAHMVVTKMYTGLCQQSNPTHKAGYSRSNCLKKDDKDAHGIDAANSLLDPEEFSVMDNEKDRSQKYYEDCGTNDQSGNVLYHRQQMMQGILFSRSQLYDESYREQHGAEGIVTLTICPIIKTKMEYRRCTEDGSELYERRYRLHMSQTTRDHQNTAIN